MMQMTTAASQGVPNGSSADIAAQLHHCIELVETLGVKLQTLDDLMLTGRPHEIAEAALVVETSLKLASPAFLSIAGSMEQLGARNLQSAAIWFRETEQSSTAGLADALRHALTRFANRSSLAHRRAQHLNRGLNAALRSLQSLGLEDAGRLIAEA